jgi:hypothetical protein
MTYKDHQLAHSALDVQDIGALNANNAALESKRWQQNVRAVVLDDLAHLVQALEDDGVNLGVSDHDRLHEDLGGHDKIVQTLLCAQDGLGALTRDVDEVVGPPRCTLGRVTEQPGERRWEVDGGARGRLNHLDVLAATAAD